MERERFDRLVSTAKEWLKTYFSSLDIVKIVNWNYIGRKQTDILFVDMLEDEAYDTRKDEVGFDDDFNKEVGMEFDLSNFAMAVPEKWYPVKRSTWSGIVVEIDEAIWMRVPREIIYGRRSSEV